MATDAAGTRPLGNVDFERVRNLYMHQGDVPSDQLNWAIGDYKAAIAAVPNGQSDPANLQALGYAIDNLGSTEWSAKGDAYFCNVFATQAYTDGAGLAMPSRHPLGNYPFSANDLGDPTKNFSPLHQVSTPIPGAIAAFTSNHFQSDSGHTTLYVGAGVLIYAGQYSVKLGTELKVLHSTSGHHFPTYRVHD